MLHFFDPPEEFSYLTRDDPTAFAPPPSFGPFRVLHQVGVGALGPVFRTYEPTRDRLVAVKVFRLDITPEQAQSLAESLSSAAEAGLFHPSIVEPIAAGVEGTVAYRAEEYVAAESLDVALRHYAPASIEKVLPFITQLAAAIDFARTAGVGHGALHPRDIFITPDEARATGFGVVEALERVGLRAPVRRPYSAPERVGGRDWGTPADVFSLGAIAYELLTARRPAGTGAQIGSLGEFGGAHATALHAVLARAMDDDPANRFPAALAFASALDAAARGQAPGPVLAPAMAAEAPVSDDRIEDSLTIMPAPAGIDEREEPAELALEEDAFRAEGPKFDDVRGELEEDQLDFALRSAEAEEDEVAPRDALIDHEAVEDLALAPPLERFASDFDPNAIEEPALLEALEEEAVSEEVPEEEPVTPARGGSLFEFDERPPIATPSRGYSSITEPPPVVERQRTSILPYALILILVSLLAFGAGYLYARRDLPQETASANVPVGASGTSATQPQGKEYSEQAVAPTPQASQQKSPAEPPAVPPEVPGRDAAPSRPETSSREAATAPKTGTITINSTPSRASVTVDGVWRGRTPLTIANLRFGSYTVRIVQEGFAVDRHVVPLSADSPVRTISSKLQRLAGAASAAPVPGATTGSLYVDSRPRGANVILDGKPVGVTPLRLAGLSTGAHTVRLELADHQPWRSNTTIVAGREARVTGSLERIR